MRFSEGCALAKIESAKSGFEYVRALIEIARETPIYVVLHPTTIVTKVRGVKRSVAVAAGSAVLCSDDAMERILAVCDYIELAEPTWLDVGLLVPLASRPSCPWFRELGIEIDEELGVATVSIEETLGEEALSVVEGGLACCVSCAEEVSGAVALEPRVNLLFLFLKSLRVRGVARVKRCVVREVSEKLKPFIDTLVRIGDSDVILALGKGYVSLFEPLDTTSRDLAAVLGLATFTRPANDPRARAYLAKILNG